MRIAQTTTHLKLPRVRFELPPHIAGAIITFALIAIAALVGRIQSAPAAVETPQPIIILATAPAIAYPTAVPQAQQAAYAPAVPRMVVAFAAPDGDVLGPIEAPTLGALVARWGDQWVATMHDGTMVWVRISELGGSLSNLAPAAPQLQPVVIYQPAPAYAPQPDYQVDTVPEPTVAPAQPAAVAAPAQQAQPVGVPTMTLREALDRTAASLQQQSGGAGTSWRLEHCVGSGDSEVCTP